MLTPQCFSSTLRRTQWAPTILLTINIENTLQLHVLPTVSTTLPTTTLTTNPRYYNLYVPLLGAPTELQQSHQQPIWINTPQFHVLPTVSTTLPTTTLTTNSRTLTSHVPLLGIPTELKQSHQHPIWINTPQLHVSIAKRSHYYSFHNHSDNQLTLL